MKSFKYFIIFFLLLPSCWTKQPIPKKHPIHIKEAPILDAIIESKRIADIYRYLKPSDYNKDTLVIFDIDNTIARPPTDLGSDQWFYALWNKLVGLGYSEQEIIDLLVPLQTYIEQYTRLVPVEPQTVQIINDLHAKGITVIALTTRSVQRHHTTVELLDQLGVLFTPTTPHEFPIPYPDGKCGFFADGIIFSGQCDKGELLTLWLKRMGHQPKKIIFIDDKMKNIQSVEKALHKLNYPVIGIRYGYLDERVKNFKLDASMEQEYRDFMKKFPLPKPLIPLEGRVYDTIVNPH